LIMNEIRLLIEYPASWFFLIWAGYITFEKDRGIGYYILTSFCPFIFIISWLSTSSLEFHDFRFNSPLTFFPFIGFIIACCLRNKNETPYYQDVLGAKLKVLTTLGIYIFLMVGISCYAIDEDEYDGRIKVSILVLPFLIYFIWQYKKEKKWAELAKETLKEKLCRVTNPENFLKPKETLEEKLHRLRNPKTYLKPKPIDKDKVVLANELYSRINQTDESDVESLKALRKEVAERLGVNFTDDKKWAKLIKKCNPKNFMTPYNEGKVRVATDLYDKLCKSDLDVDEMEEIEEGIKQLYAKEQS